MSAVIPGMPTGIVGNNPLCEKIIKKYGILQTYRATNWQTHWKEVSYYVVPKKDNIYGEVPIGNKKENKLYDSTGVMANELLASALHGMLTNPSSIWFGLSTGDDELDNRDDVRKWIQKTVKKMIDTLNSSNFQTEVHEIYIDLGSFGTACLRIEEDDDYVVRFEARPIYEATINENFKGLVDTVYYEYYMTLEQIRGEFGAAAFTPELERQFAANPLERQKVLHAVEPRDSNPNIPMVPTNMPFASYHILMPTRMILKEGGFMEFPYAVPRWTKLSSEMLGRSPGMKALSDIKMLNAMKKATIEAAQMVITPPLQAPDDGVLLPLKIKPGGINYYRAGSKDRIEPLQTGANIQLSDKLMEGVKQQIKEAFFIDQLVMPTNDRMTATEINQRKDEQLRMLGPILGRMDFEFLRPLIERVFNIMKRKGLIENPPMDIVKKHLTVKYVSMIAKAQKGVEAVNFGRTMEMVGGLASVQQDILDNIDGDKVVRGAAEIFGLPAEFLRDEAEVKKMRAGRAQAQQEQAQQQQQMAQADTVNKLQGTANQQP